SRARLGTQAPGQIGRRLTLQNPRACPPSPRHGTSLPPHAGKSMQIAMIGSGYVGLVSGACFADFGHNVVCVDNDPRKIDALKRGEIPIFEPGLDEIVARNAREGRLSFTGNLAEALDKAEVVFIA